MSRPWGVQAIADTVICSFFRQLLNNSSSKSCRWEITDRKNWHMMPLHRQKRTAGNTNGWLIWVHIRGFFDNLDHALLLNAVDHLHPALWVRLCIVRWLKAEIIFPDRHRHSPEKGTPQGCVITPLCGPPSLAAKRDPHRYVPAWWFSQQSHEMWVADPAAYGLHQQPMM